MCPCRHASYSYVLKPALLVRQVLFFSLDNNKINFRLSSATEVLISILYNSLGEGSKVCWKQIITLAEVNRLGTMFSLQQDINRQAHSDNNQFLSSAHSCLSPAHSCLNT